jgi:hypothetical protein
MAKAGKKKAKNHATSPDDPLAEATDLLERGDYAKARLLLTEKAKDAKLSDSTREAAAELARATTLDRQTLWVGLACIGLLLLVIIVTTLTQPH